MGMAVKGEREHRLVRMGLDILRRHAALDQGVEAPAVARLIRRADLAIDRIKVRKARRAARAQEA